MRNLLFVAAVVVLLVAIVPGCGNNDDISTAGRIERDGVMLVGTDATYIPFEYVSTETSKPEGFDIDLMNRLCVELGAKPEFIISPFDGIIAGLTTSKFDCIISAMTITDERAERVSFSMPYYAAGQTIAVRSDNETIKSIDDLKGKKVGVQMGTTGMYLAQGLTDVEVFPFDHIGAAFIDLENGQVDAVINDKPVTLIAIRERGTFRMVGETLTTESYGIAVRQTDTLLLGKINAALEKLEREGFLDELQAKWF
ncbi:MAG: basic amino acid ABC transporter substrate-binding protein [candidate division Zixibacteria bacterium]|nr:basic amino acid ABC transporter substrate-binding protein [candidate division Zixibacteria bacterium]MBU1470409.1 basic amino acid ABC transporter substrate-binding protein [candidate division Zixibacteria bacterium]MBU2625838.1 basic amino acid ABC transporter substrate-binding protein [candidate division Zixibacteria bacterium]